MATSREENPVLVDQFVAVTGATRATAVSMLEACAGNLDLAVGMHMDGQGAAGSSRSMQEDAAVASGAGPINQEDYDDVRAPIPQKTEVLVEDDSYKFASWRMRRPRRMVRSVFDGFRDFQAEAKNYEEGIHGKSSSKKRNLEDLFRPPVDITHKGTFQSARDTGSSKNQWILVNVQNVQEFECQILNRDVWSCQLAKRCVTTNFIFWQVYNDSAEGKRFMQFYKVSKWPYVAIVDPFTGENQIVWHQIPDGKTFCELANEFLAMHPAPCKNDSESPPSKRAKLEDSIVDASEQDQMEAAIRASLCENKAKTKKSPLYVIDSDSEPDLIEDSEDEIETFSDSDAVVESTPVKEQKSSPQKRQLSKLINACSTSSSSSSSSSSSTRSSLTSTSPSKCSSKPNTNKYMTESSCTTRKTHKDSYLKCKNLSTSKKTSCSYTPLSFNPENCASSNPSMASGMWEDPAGSSSIMDSSLGVSVDSSFPDTLSARDSEVCTLSNSPCSSLTSDVSGLTDATTTQEMDWKQYWGDEKDPMSKIMIRFPDSRREQVELPSSSSLKALKVFCASLGFVEDKYELVTNFPRRQLSEIDDSKTLKAIGLYPQDTVFIQEL